MAASFPTSVHSFASKTDGVDDVLAAHVNDIQLEVAAIETQLLTTGTWVPTFAGFSADPSGGLYRYVLIGKTCIAMVEMPTGTSNDTMLTLTAPFTARTATGMFWRALSSVVTNGGTTATEHPGRVFIGSGGTVITCYRTLDSTATWTNSGTKRCCFTLIYEIA